MREAWLLSILIGPLVVIAVALGAAETLPPALVAMAEAERAFAKRAAASTVREAFIEFFADESVSFEPDPGPARERLKASTRPQPPGFQLLWEPRMGDIAASSDLGFLTGPAEYINPGQPNRFTNYFSVWKRQPNGDYRVILDIGVATPEKPSFAAGLTRARATATWRGSADRAADEASLSAADRKLAAAAASTAAADAYGAALHPDARLMRHLSVPLVTRDAAVAWLRQETASMTMEPLKAEVAQSGELGYTWGKVSVDTAKGTRSTGYYVRVWTRQADGSWLIAADVVTPPR